MTLATGRSGPCNGGRHHRGHHLREPTCRVAVPGQPRQLRLQQPALRSEPVGRGDHDQGPDQVGAVHRQLQRHRPAGGLPVKNTGSARSSSMAVARCPAMSDIDSPGRRPLLAVDQIHPELATQRHHHRQGHPRSIPVGTSCVGVRPCTITSGGPSPTARYGIPSPSSPLEGSDIAITSPLLMLSPPLLYRQGPRSPKLPKHARCAVAEGARAPPRRSGPGRYRPNRSGTPQSGRRNRRTRHDIPAQRALRGPVQHLQG